MHTKGTKDCTICCHFHVRLAAVDMSGVASKTGRGEEKATVWKITPLLNWHHEPKKTQIEDAIVNQIEERKTCAFSRNTSIKGRRKMLA